MCRWQCPDNCMLHSEMGLSLCRPIAGGCVSPRSNLKPDRSACSTVACTLVRSHVDTPRTGIARPSDRGTLGVAGKLYMRAMKASRHLTVRSSSQRSLIVLNRQQQVSCTTMQVSQCMCISIKWASAHVMPALFFLCFSQTPPPEAQHVLFHGTLQLIVVVKTHCPLGKGTASTSKLDWV